MIILKSDSEIDGIKKSCRLAASALKHIESHLTASITTLEINDLCHDFIVSHGAIPAPLNYRGFPKSICTSINDVVCHGIPSSKVKLKDGDIVNIDVTTILDGYHGDLSKTYCIGEVSAPARNLVKIALECLQVGIRAVKVGNRVGDIGQAIQLHAEKHGYSVVREFVGHGIGKLFHEDPQVPHFGKAGEGSRLEKGMTFTIEPMVNQGHWKTKIKKDGWTAITLDGSLSAQFEHTIAIRNDGVVEILTADVDELSRDV